MPPRSSFSSQSFPWDSSHVRSVRRAKVTSKDMPIKGEMSRNGLVDMKIDLYTLSADEFIKKHC